MACKNRVSFWSYGDGRYKIIEPGSFLSGQTSPVHADYAGFRSKRGPGMARGQLVTIDCRKCSGCILRYQNSIVGSALAEMGYAQNAIRFDMTYANDPGSNTRSDLANKMFIPKHITDFTERLRRMRDFGRVRYLIGGEHGPLHGRVHYHSVLIFEDKMPAFDFSSDRYNDERLWPYGFVSAKPITSEAQVSYAIKYCVKGTKALKDSNDYMPGMEVLLRRSSIPPLGQPFFIDKAIQEAEYGIPLSMKYFPTGGHAKANYHVRGKAIRKRMCHAFLDHLELQGYDTEYFDYVPPGYEFTGPRIPYSTDPDLARLLEETVRERRLDQLPIMTNRQEKRAMRAEFRDREAKQERINAREAEQREAAKVRRAKSRMDAFTAHFLDQVGSDDWIAYDDEIADQLLGSARRRRGG